MENYHDDLQEKTANRKPEKAILEFVVTLFVALIFLFFFLKILFF